MFIQLVRVHVKPDKVDTFRELIRANHEGSVREPGCLRFDVAQSKDDPTRFVLWECYVDEEANRVPQDHAPLPRLPGGHGGPDGRGSGQRAPHGRLPGVRTIQRLSSDTCP